jgi:hypothetical protein
MRFISLSPGMKRTVIHAEQTLVNTPRGPEQIQSREPYIAKFRQGGATAAETALALSRFQIKGLGERENPARRLSIYDTDEAARAENWTPELKAEIEQSLLSGVGQFYFQLEVPRVDLPWPAYATADPEDVVRTAGLVGVSLEHVLAYETENANRPAVVAEIKDALAANDEVEIEA